MLILTFFHHLSDCLGFSLFESRVSRLLAATFQVLHAYPLTSRPNSENSTPAFVMQVVQNGLPDRFFSASSFAVSTSTVMLPAEGLSHSGRTISKSPISPLSTFSEIMWI